MKQSGRETPAEGGRMRRAGEGGAAGMAEPFLGEIRVFGFSWAPQDWALCNGALMPVGQYQALFSLLGIAYGGDGRNNFGLPDLQGRTPIGVNAASGRPPYALGEKGGMENVVLTADTIPAHNHAIQGAANAAASLSAPSPAGNFPATVHLPDSTIPPTGHQLYGSPTNLTPLNPGSLGATGSGQGHNNMQPYAVVNYCIAVKGYYPPRQ
jgi:microcystin-dependent protein